jgi:predicted ATPase
MINTINIDGFKSLSNFKIDLTAGINVLVGPNGSGKSNILSLVEFLSNLSNYRLPEAVSRSGGAGTIFRRLASEKVTNSIKLKIEGYGSMRTRPGYYYSPARPRYLASRKEYYCEYEYLAEIILAESGTALGYKNQRVCLSVFQDPVRRTLLNRKTGEKRWHLDIDASVTSNKVKIKKNKINYSAFKKALGQSNSKMPEYFINDANELANYPLYTLIERFISPASRIHADVDSGQIYNLIPKNIKEPEDIARTPVISPDGSGLAATLYKIQEQDRDEIGPRFFYKFNNDELVIDTTLEELKHLYTLINDNIIDVRVENNALENKLVIIAQVASDEGRIEIPLAMLSDGTVKWLALVTAILSKKAIFSLEEPENYLHPHMQREIVDILRNTAKQTPNNFAIITTHSETLLNSLDPSEIIVTKMKNGKTKVGRSRNVDIIRSEINETGFGLGYYIISGAVDID